MEPRRLKSGQLLRQFLARLEERLRFLLFPVLFRFRQGIHCLGETRRQMLFFKMAQEFFLFSRGRSTFSE